MATKGLLNWSKTAATNATADSQAQFAEGQAPSSLNDGIRGAMASMAMWRDDVSGSLTTGGTSTAYTVTTNQDATTLAQLNAQIITIVPHATNGASPTLAVNGLTAKSIRTETGVSVGAGVMIAGTPYQLVYFSSAGEFILMNFATNPYIIPIGAMLPWTLSAVPNSNFVFPSGQAISRTTYSTYFNQVGTFYGAGDSSTTFNVLNLEGKGISCLETSASLLTTAGCGIDGATRGATGGAQTITLDTTMIPSHLHAAGTLTHYASIAQTGWGTTGGNIGTVASGRLVVGSGNFENTESLESLRAAGNSIVLDSGATQSVAGSTASTGGGAAHRNVQPTMILPFILRII